MIENVTVTVGSDLIAYGIGQPIRGLAIDNPSAAWLEVAQRFYVPPFTLQWAVGFPSALSTFDVKWLAIGPGGKPSSLTGKPAFVRVSTDPMHNSAGISYLSNP